VPRDVDIVPSSALDQLSISRSLVIYARLIQESSPLALSFPGRKGHSSVSLLECLLRPKPVQAKRGKLHLGGYIQ